MTSDLHPELERRIQALESVSDEPTDFDAKTWVWLIILGIVVPVIAIVWGVS